MLRTKGGVPFVHPGQSRATVGTLHEYVDLHRWTVVKINVSEAIMMP